MPRSQITNYIMYSWALYELVTIFHLKWKTLSNFTCKIFQRHKTENQVFLRKPDLFHCAMSNVSRAFQGFSTSVRQVCNAVNIYEKFSHDKNPYEIIPTCKQHFYHEFSLHFHITSFYWMLADSRSQKLSNWIESS